MTERYLYCEGTTTAHKTARESPQCLHDLNSLIVKEGFKEVTPLFINQEVVINLDNIEALESAKANSQKLRSMDFAFGVRNNNVLRVVMVELRLNYNNPNNLSKAEIEEKVAGSSIRLGDTPSLYQEYFFIFKTAQIQEAISRLYRMIPRINSKFKAIDIHALKTYFF